MRILASALLLVCACGDVIGPVTVTISPAEPTTTDDLVASVQDGEGRDLSYRWLNGTASGPTGEMVSADMTSKGEVWTVEVIDRGAVVGTASVRIGNAPAVVMAPTFASPNFAAAPLSCVAQATDPDGDPTTVSVAWEKNGAPYTGTLMKKTVSNDTIPRATTKTGEVYKCTVTANDGTGPKTAEATITVAPRLAYTISEGT